MMKTRKFFTLFILFSFISALYILGCTNDDAAQGPQQICEKAGNLWVNGECLSRANLCGGKTCAETEQCINDKCEPKETDPCMDVECVDGSICKDGVCACPEKEIAIYDAEDNLLECKYLCGQANGCGEGAVCRREGEGESARDLCRCKVGGNRCDGKGNTCEGDSSCARGFCDESSSFEAVEVIKDGDKDERLTGCVKSCGDFEMFSSNSLYPRSVFDEDFYKEVHENMYCLIGKDKSERRYCKVDFTESNANCDAWNAYCVGDSCQLDYCKRMYSGGYWFNLDCKEAKCFKEFGCGCGSDKPTKLSEEPKSCMKAPGVDFDRFTRSRLACGSRHGQERDVNYCNCIDGYAPTYRYNKDGGKTFEGCVDSCWGAANNCAPGAECVAQMLTVVDGKPLFSGRCRCFNNDGQQCHGINSVCTDKQCTTCDSETKDVDGRQRYFSGTNSGECGNACYPTPCYPLYCSIGECRACNLWVEGTTDQCEYIAY